MKPNISSLISKLHAITDIIRRYRVVLFALFFLCLYGFLIMRINNLTNSEPSPATAAEQSKSIKRLKIDQASIDSLLELEEQNVEVKTLFQEARENPFTE